MKDVFKIEVDENGLYYTITLLDKCYEIVYIHDTDHREIVDGSGVIKNLPVNDEVIVYINMKDICKPDVKPELTPETPETPEQPKVPEFLPETGFGGLLYGVFGLGLVGVGLVTVNKKRK
jgi:LPXTG-motif cell wall-anchored protein